MIAPGVFFPLLITVAAAKTYCLRKSRPAPEPTRPLPPSAGPRWYPRGRRSRSRPPPPPPTSSWSSLQSFSYAASFRFASPVHPGSAVTSAESRSAATSPRSDESALATSASSSLAGGAVNPNAASFSSRYNTSKHPRTARRYPPLSSASASSKTTCLMCTTAGWKFPRRHPPSLNRSTSAAARAGVATTTSGKFRSSSIAFGVNATVRTSGVAPSARLSESAAAATCAQSVAFGHRISAPTRPTPTAFRAVRFDMIGARYAKVFPEPVSAARTTSSFAAMEGIAAACVVVASSNPSAESARATSACKEEEDARDANDVDVADPSSAAAAAAAAFVVVVVVVVARRLPGATTDGGGRSRDYDDDYASLPIARHASRIIAALEVVVGAGARVARIRLRAEFYDALQLLFFSSSLGASFYRSCCAPGSGRSSADGMRAAFVAARVAPSTLRAAGASSSSSSSSSSRRRSRPAAMASSASPSQADLDLASALADASADVVLGSESWSRRAILNEMGIPHRTVPARIDEKAIRVDDPGELVMALARAKATAVVRKLREEASSSASSSSSSSRRTTLVIASDQVVVCDGVVREKPADAAQARAFIASYGRSPPSTVGAIVVADVDTGAVFAASDTSTIAFRGPIPEATVGAFLYFSPAATVFQHLIAWVPFN